MVENSPSFTPTAPGSHDAKREELFKVLYAELHRIAERELKKNSGVTLSATTLLHETFLSMSRTGSDPALADQARFMAHAGCAMRGLLIDYLHTRQAQQRGGKFEITSLPADVKSDLDTLDAQKLGAALDELSNAHPRLAECVDLRFFCGLSCAEIGRVWGVSERTVQREWEKARILLHRLLTDQALP